MKLKQFSVVPLYNISVGARLIIESLKEVGLKLLISTIKTVLNLEYWHFLQDNIMAYLQQEWRIDNEL